MSPATRKTYFGLWGATCAALGWSVKDETKRRTVTAQCMQLIGGPQTESTSDLGHDEITALFLYLQFLASAGSDLDLSARWLDCQQDYRAFNRARQADHLEGELYGRGRKNKLDRNRFRGETSAAGGPLDKFDPEAIRKRHLTMATRARKKAAKAVQSPAPASTPPAPDRTQAPELSENPF